MNYALIGIRTDGDTKLIERSDKIENLSGGLIDKALKQYPDHRILCVAKGDPMDLGLNYHQIVKCNGFEELQGKMVFHAVDIVKDNRVMYEEKLYSSSEKIIPMDTMEKIQFIKTEGTKVEVMQCWLHGRIVSVIIEPHKQKDGTIEIKPLAVILDNQLFSELIPITDEDKNAASEGLK
jgi:hypothetical protein